MPITVKCSQCGALANAPDNSMGEFARCLECLMVFKIDAGTLHSPLSDIDSDSEIAPATAPRVIPSIVRIYGHIYGVFGALAALFSLGTALYVLSTKPEKLNLPYSVTCFLSGLILFEIGRGFVKGRRNAVSVLLILVSFSFAAAVGYLVTGRITSGIVGIAVLSICYVPPIVSAYFSWQQLE